MKTLLTCIFSIAALNTWAQENKTVVFNAVNPNEEFSRSIYQYSQFINGKAFYKNGSVAEARLNYNCLTNQIVFIDPKGDTLALDLGESFSRIVIETDTFYYNNHYFIQQLTHYPTYNLFTKHSLKFAGNQKKDAYGVYSNTTSNNSISTVSNNATVNTIGVDENILYSFVNTYFISDRFGRYHPATKKGFYDLFAKNEKQIREYLGKNDINFSKREDVEKLLDFIRTLL